MKPVSKDSSSTADQPAQPATGIAHWELKELFWAKSPYEAKETPKQHYAWAIAGDDLYISPIHSEAQARLIYAAPNLLKSCIDLLAIVRLQNGNLHDDVNAIQKMAEAAIFKATLP